MATWGAIAGVGQTLLGLVADACPKPEFSNAAFQLYQGEDFKTPLEEGVSLYLYRVEINGTHRNLVQRTTVDGRRFLPSLPLDLHYLLTPWAKDAAKQQRLLGWCMRALEDTPILPSGLLNHFCPDPETFRSSETVELVAEPLSLQDLTNIWDTFKPTVQLSAGYVVRMVVIDSDRDLSDGAPVQTRAFQFASVP